MTSVCCSDVQVSTIKGNADYTSKTQSQALRNWAGEAELR